MPEEGELVEGVDDRPLLGRHQLISVAQRLDDDPLDGLCHSSSQFEFGRHCLMRGISAI